MKRIFYGALLALVSLSATAQTLSVQPIEAQAGAQTELVVSLSGATAMSALQFNLTLPEDVTAGDNVTLGPATNGHTLSVQTLASGDRLFILYSMDLNTFREGELLRIPVNVGGEAQTGEGRLYTVRTASTEAVSQACSEVPFDVTVSERVSLDDTEEIDYSGIQNSTVDLHMNRTLQSGSYNTLALPFAMTLNAFKAKIGDNDVKVKELVGATFSDGILSLTFGNAASIEAGMPYLVKLSGEDNILLGDFDDVTMPETVAPQTVNADDVAEFVASLGKTLVTGSTDYEDEASTVLLLGAENKLFNPIVVNTPADDASYIKGFRAYFRLKGAAAVQGARQMVIKMDDDPMAISVIPESTVNGQSSVNNGVWYDISGRKYDSKPAKKGVYIVNGVKTAVE